MKKFQSTKVFDGFSTVFRQWRATDTHCQYLHGYGVKFKVWFEGELDHRNWVLDFGLMKRTKTTIDGMKPKDWMNYMFDHTIVIAKDDPYYDELFELRMINIAQVRTVETVGAEAFAKLVFDKLDNFCNRDTNGRVRVVKVEFSEHEKNSAIYSENHT